MGEHHLARGYLYAIRSSLRILTAALTILVVLSVAWTPVSHATEIYIPEIKGQAGKHVEVPVMIDKVDNLAGIKLVIRYDPGILTYKKGDKTKQTSSLMHIVNNKKPGLLIAVMAGARGIKGKDFPILVLTFEAGKNLKEKTVTRLDITELELMSDTLQDIKGTIRIDPLVLLPDGASKQDPASAPSPTDKSP